MMKTPEALMRDARTGQWLIFRHPRRVVATHDLATVRPLMSDIERAVREQGLWAAGFLSYEAGPAFDAALAAHSPLGDVPLLWFGLFDAPERLETLPWPRSDAFHLGPLQSPMNATAYTTTIAAIKAAIARGDVYQVNFTFPIFAPFDGDPRTFFLHIQQNQHARFAAYLEIGDLVISSASPELFFYRDHERVWMRPMKGTAPRGNAIAEDERLAQELAASLKNRAENVMIVDMVRNDLGRIAEIGSVRTTDLFRIESYPTLFQMTSTVQARTSASLVRLLDAVFPAASITGAPKVSATRIIRQLETGPRGVYTGAIGFLSPDSRAQFNVAIRTAVIHRKAQTLRYDVGSGVVWDSEADSEFDECWLKAQALTRPIPRFQLLESLLWTPEQGFVLLDRHLHRMCASASTFRFPCPVETMRQRLDALIRTLPPRQHKIRLLLASDGSIHIEAALLQPASTPQRIALASFPVEPDDLFLRHKTTRREIYETAMRAHPQEDDVLLWNRRGELTESARANLVLSLGGQMWTPAASSGLLPGVLRAELLAQGKIREAILTKDDLHSADAVYLINSVRGWMPATVVE